MIRIVQRVAKKELIQTFRDRKMLGVLLIAPVVQVVLFGFAVNLDLTAQPLAVADADRTRASREIVRAITESDGFTLTVSARDEAEAERALETGEASLALLVPRGYGARLAAGSAEIALVVDGSDSNTAVRAGQEAGQILTAQAIGGQRAKIAGALAAAGRTSDRGIPEIAIEPRIFFNPQLRSAIFLVPGVLALVLAVITMMLTAMGLTREKEMGTLEQIMVTPIRPLDLMLGKTLPFAVLGLLDLGLSLSIAVLVFDLPVRGSLVEVYAATLLYLMTTLGMGLFISTVSATQQQAMLTAFFFLLPALMLSGLIFPIDNMPEPVQWLTQVNPLRHYIEIVRGVLVKGASLGDLWRQTGSLAALGALVLAGASLRFRKRIA
jgi:ABC-2 type transport system permease protein